MQEAVEPPVAAAVEPVLQAVQQVQPVNINISVRADSPGDNGPVTQINAAVLAPLLVATPPEVRYQQHESQYHDPPASNQSQAVPDAPAGPAPTAEAPATPLDSWDWTWTWSCGDAIAPAIVLPANYLQQIWNWNWNWNCGANDNVNGNSESQLPSQYQPVTSQYQPINVNIAIRIASPGNDGPVVQANLAVAMPTLVLAAPTRPAPLPVPRPAPLPASGPPAAPVPVENTPQPAEQSTEAAAEPSESPSAPEDTPSPAASAPSRTPNIDTTPIRSVLDRAPGLAHPDTTRATTRAAPVAAVSAEAIAALARPAPAVAAGKRANAQEQRAKTHARPITPKHAAVGALSYASFAPLGAGGSDRTLQLIFLIFVPFLFAFADAARRVAEERKAAAADSGRRREKPG